MTEENALVIVEQAAEDYKPRRDLRTKLEYHPRYADDILDYFEQAKLKELAIRTTETMEEYGPKKTAEPLVDPEISRIPGIVSVPQGESGFPSLMEPRRQKGMIKRETKSVCAEMPTFNEFARTIGTSAQTLLRWEDRHPDFREACLRCRDIQDNWLWQTGLSDRVQPAAFEFVATNVTKGRMKRAATLDVNMSATGFGPGQLAEDPRPELADVPAEDLDRLQGLGRMFASGLSPEQRRAIDAALMIPAAIKAQTQNGQPD